MMDASGFAQAEEAKSARKQSIVTATARKAMREADGDREEAARIMEKLVDGNSELAAELFEPLKKQAVWEAIRKVASDTRGALFRNREPSVAGLVAMARSFMDDYLLPDGVKLGDATENNLRDAISVHMLNATSNKIKAAWLEKIVKARKAKGAQPGQPTREVLSDQELTEMRNEARKNV